MTLSSLSYKLNSWSPHTSPQTKMVVFWYHSVTRRPTLRHAGCSQCPRLSHRPLSPSPRRSRRPNAGSSLCCALVGSTAFANQLDLTELHEVGRASQGICVEVVQRFDGHIVPYRGVRRRKVQGGNRQSSEGTSQSTARRPVGIALKIVPGYKYYANAAHIANRVKKLSRHGSYSLHSLGIALCLRVLARIRRRRSGVRPLSG